MRKKALIWELFFAFHMCWENSYFLRKLAIIAIQKTEVIIFISYFIIKLHKMAHINHLIPCKKCWGHRNWDAKKLPYGNFFSLWKSLIITLSMGKKAPLCVAFFACLDLWSSLFCTVLHRYMNDVYLCHFICLFVKIILTDLWIT